MPALVSLLMWRHNVIFTLRTLSWERSDEWQESNARSNEVCQDQRFVVCVSDLNPLEDFILDLQQIDPKVLDYAASKLQAGFRGYMTRKNMHHWSTEIQMGHCPNLLTNGKMSSNLVPVLARAGRLGGRKIKKSLFWAYLIYTFQTIILNVYNIFL